MTMTAHEALTLIAAFHDVGGNEHLERFGSYGAFDEPGAVRLARTTLAAIAKNGGACVKGADCRCETKETQLTCFNWRPAFLRTSAQDSRDALEALVKSVETGDGRGQALAAAYALLEHRPAPLLRWKGAA